MIRRPNLLVSPILFCISMLAGCASDPMLAKHYELCAYVPANVKLDVNSRVGGKIAVVYKGSNYKTGLFGDCEMDGYSERGSPSDTTYFPAEMYARSPNEIETLIMIELKKGTFLKPVDAQRSVSSKTSTDLFSGITEISIIDYKTSTLVRNLAKENTNIPSEIRMDRLKLPPGQDRFEYVIEPTSKEIRTYLRGISNAVKPE